jgi:hypothetical protein
MPDLIRHPGPFWIPAFTGMTALIYIIAGVITGAKKRANLLNFLIRHVARWVGGPDVASDSFRAGPEIAAADIQPAAVGAAARDVRFFVLELHQ